MAQFEQRSETEIIILHKIKMKCSLLHLIFVIIFGSVVYGFSIPKVTVKLLRPKGIQFSLKGLQKSSDTETEHRVIEFLLLLFPLLLRRRRRNH